jgi:hypothetical protein
MAKFLGPKLIGQLMSDPSKAIISVVTNWGPDFEQKLLKFTEDNRKKFLEFDNEKELAIMLIPDKDKAGIDAMLVAIDYEGKPCRVIMRENLLKLVNILIELTNTELNDNNAKNIEK